MTRRFKVAELSMSPALAPGQEVTAELLTGPPARGAIVFFEHPDRADFWLVKRVVGLPGEQITIVDGELSIDGAGYDDPWTVDDTRPDGAWPVPPGRMFVLSDARGRSAADSRSFGPVPIDGAYRMVDPQPG